MAHSHLDNHTTEPTQEPTPASPSKTTRNDDDTFLSPVSKLELAKQFAAKEQQKRVDAVCSRMAEAKKEENLNRLRIEDQLESHLQQRQANDENTNNMSQSATGAISTIASKFVGAFKSVLNLKDPNNTAEESVSYSPTRELLRAARETLSAEGSRERINGCPVTNFHLKQLGLVNEKINIYAPIHEQQQGLRQRHRRDSALRCQQSFSELRDDDNMDDDSGDDSDYAPEVDVSDDSDSDSEFESDELEMDKDEMRHLMRDQTMGVDHYLAAIRKRTKKASPCSSVVIIVVFVLVALLAVMLSEENSGFCQNLVANPSSNVEDTRRSMCSVVLQLHRVLRALKAIVV